MVDRCALLLRKNHDKAMDKKVTKAKTAIKTEETMMCFLFMELSHYFVTAAIDRNEAIAIASEFLSQGANVHIERFACGL